MKTKSAVKAWSRKFIYMFPGVIAWTIRAKVIDENENCVSVLGSLNYKTSACDPEENIHAGSRRAALMRSCFVNDVVGMFPEKQVRVYLKSYWVRRKPDLLKNFSST